MGMEPTRRPLRAVSPEARAQNTTFAANLDRLMRTKGLSQSAVARQIWGETKDSRGYSVARNRDRVSAYLAGAGIPEPENLKKLASVLGVKVEDLIDLSTRPLSTRAMSAQGDVHLVMLPDQPGYMVLKVNTVLPMKVAMQIAVLIEDARKRENP